MALDLKPILEVVKLGINTVVLSAVPENGFVATPSTGDRHFRVTVRLAEHDRGKPSSKQMTAMQWLLLSLQIGSVLLLSNTSVTVARKLVDIYPSVQGVDLHIMIERIPAPSATQPVSKLLEAGPEN